MSDVANFIAQYTPADRVRLAFAWNGRHATEFSDANQEFRWEVASSCIASPQIAPPLLLEHLFLADAEWSREAWCAPNHFSELGAVLLARGQEATLGAFAKGFVSSFDTFGACHELQLSSDLVQRLLVAANQSRAAASDESERKPIDAAVELFEKLQRGRASDGWAKLSPGTPVSNIRVVSPPWYLRAWAWLASRRGRNAT